MKFIRPSVEILTQAPGLEGIKKQIEIAGRTAYKSEDKITEDSCNKFVDMLASRKHGAALEHGTVYLKVPGILDPWAFKIYKDNKYSFVYKDNVTEADSPYYVYDLYITTNYRVLVENNRLDDLKYLSDYIDGKHEKRVTVKFVLSRGIANEFVRHRNFSFLQESTRFCNYGKKGSGITYIMPSFFPKNSYDFKVDVEYYRGFKHPDVILYSSKDGEDFYVREGTANYAYLYSLLTAEESYLFLTQKAGVKPQFARDVLPLDLKTELVMTGTVNQWREFFKLRCAPDAHPDAKSLADNLRELFFQHGWYTELSDF